MSGASWLSVRSASIELDGISERLIREAVNSGELPAARWGKTPEKDAQDRRSIRIDRADLVAWAESKKAAA